MQYLDLTCQAKQAVLFAIQFWVKACQNGILSDLELGAVGKGRFKGLNLLKRNDGIYIVKGRTEHWNELSYNEDVALLPKGHRFAQLYAEYVHNKDHIGVHAGIAKVRAKFWIIGIEKLMKSITYSCSVCRRNFRKHASQVMASLPIDKLKPALPFSVCGIDLFGPFWLKGEVNKRSSGKGYGIIFTCFVTRAVYLDLATDYSTDGFLVTFRRFVTIRGYPRKIYSDRGSQLIAASKELRAMFKHLDWDRLKGVSVENGLEWVFSPAEAPWYNGSCEALINSAKKCLTRTIGTQN